MKLRSRVKVQLVSADIGGILKTLNEQGVAIYELTPLPDGLTCTFWLDEGGYPALQRLAERRGDSLQILKKRSISLYILRLLKRPVLCLGMLIFLLLTLYLPDRILFLQVVGNTSVPTKQILAVAQDCGLQFGVSRRALRSEKVKNALLEAMPELKWAGINTAGCLATISVRQRSEGNDSPQTGGVSSIVALRDGVITELIVEKGSGQCAVGQAVKAGQVLISGYTDCGLTIRATNARGEVFAATQRTLTAVLPAQQMQRGNKTSSTQKITLILGKKRINFYKGSGISPNTCVKMYVESYLTLPGGLQLPIGIVTETWEAYDTVEATASHPSGGELEQFAKSYLLQHMIAGQILSQETEEGQDGGVLWLRGEFACREMIGKVRNEESLTGYGN